MQVSIRRFEARDIPAKVRWINDPANNRYLHYDLPLEEGKTQTWFEKNRDRTDRYDAVIEADGKPVGLIGLLGIDHKNSKAEYYIAMGDRGYTGRGVAAEASRLLLEYAFHTLGLNRVYLYTERENLPAQRLFKRLGFAREGLLRHDLYARGHYVDRYAYGLTREQYLSGAPDAALNTPLQDLGAFMGNRLYMKREDMIPFSFGGNKVRKALRFFEEIDRGDYDTLVTYGSSSSNHCRAVANMAAQRGMACRIISPEEASEETANSLMMRLFGAEIILCPVRDVHDTIENTLADLRAAGKKPFFIMGGGHGNTGTQAYVDCWREITAYEAANGLRFDMIFFASGTGTTQAGLVCGRLMDGASTQIIGVSIARKNPRGRQVVLDSVREYLEYRGFACDEAAIDEAVVFLDDYTGAGYAASDAGVQDCIRRVLTACGVPLDATYTGKAFRGMEDYIARGGIHGKNILFIHTGGTPLFFDSLRSMQA